jgi:hypothetical protein
MTGEGRLAAWLELAHWAANAGLAADHASPPPPSHVTLSRLYNHLGKAGVWLRVPRQCHVKKDPAAAPRFHETLPVQLAALVLPKDRPVRLWVQDEMHYGRHGFARQGGGLSGRHPAGASMGLPLRSGGSEPDLRAVSAG